MIDAALQKFRPAEPGETVSVSQRAVLR